MRCKACDAIYSTNVNRTIENEEGEFLEVEEELCGKCRYKSGIYSDQESTITDTGKYKGHESLGNGNYKSRNIKIE